MVVALTLTATPLIGFLMPEVQAKSISEYAVGDIIEFGTYPQSEVTDSVLLESLNKLSLNWISYDYYSGTGDISDGQMKPGDFMKYADITYGDEKYRAVKFTQYRPYITEYTCSASRSYQDDNGYITGSIYWFKYEPLEWRVLDPAEGFIMCESVIDSQAYSNVVYYNSSRYRSFNSTACTSYASDYETSSIREWLNDDFYNTAFSSSEKAFIGTTTLDNSGYSSSYPEYDSNTTNDKIFLLSYSESLNSSYGFVNSSTRDAKLTEYAQCQGGCTHNNSNTCWWLRTPENSAQACHVDEGNVYSIYVGRSFGIRPALKVKTDIEITLPENPDVTDKPDEETAFISINETVNYYSSGNGKAASMDMAIACTNFANSSLVYDHNLAAFCSQAIVLGYTNKEKDNETVFRTALEKLGFKDVEVNLNTSSTQVNYFIARHKINIDGEIYNLIFTGFIGSHYGQWYNNFMPGTGATHQGFAGARDFVYGKLRNYIATHNLNFSKGNNKILVTGHSRGAATANLVAAKLIDTEEFAYADNVYAYTFATPNPTSESSRTNSKYNRIFNIVNPEDFVTKVMPNAWEFGRYGITLVLPSKTNTSGYKTHLNKMRQYFGTIAAGDTYQPFANGEKATYDIVKKFTGTVSDVNDFYSTKWRFLDGVQTSPYEYFQKVICPLVGEKEVANQVVPLGLLATSAIPGSTSSPYDDFSRFFLNNAVLYRLNSMIPSELELVLPAIHPALAILDLTLDSGKPYFEDAHLAETYCAYMMTMSSADLWSYKIGYENTVNCPVDIEVINNATGEVVGRITNNVVDESIANKENAIVMSVDGDSKSFWLPADGDYEVKLTGNDTGTMDYTVAEINPDSSEQARVNFFDVNIADELEMTGEIDSNLNLENYALAYESGKILKPTQYIDGNSNTVTITTSTNGYGATNGNMTVTCGDYVTVTAFIESSSLKFVKWIDEKTGETVSTDAEYSFVAKKDVSLKAVFIVEVLSIATPSTTVINYGETLVLTLENVEIPEGYSIEWYILLGSGVSAYKNETGTECRVTSVANGSATFAAVLVDENGEAVTDENGNEINDLITITSRAGFWQKLVSFFKNLFGINRIIY